MMVKKYWNDQIRNITIGSLFGGILLGIASYLFPSIPAFLGSEVTIPVWLIALIILPLLTLSILYLTSIITKFFADEGSNAPIINNTGPDFLDYTKDHILGIDWEWRWVKNMHSIKGYVPSSLQARCPKCKSIFNITHYDGVSVLCINGKCEWKWSSPPKENNPFENLINYEFELKNSVKTEIDRKIQTGEWKSD